ncbi:HIT family protein [Chitinivorax sp. B]|uniref:HIT family protein n=1 Tax=Chitinivorax sp. B TaxID=2502235 RepID=UPI0010F4C220|nr:HIT family protein [Chitinivorax sp. B]
MACELCEQPGGELLWQDERCRVVRVADADYPGFCRVIWSAHVKEMTDLPIVDQQHLMRIVLLVEQAVRDVLTPEKINLASLGNMTPHLHWHVIPRFADDRHFPSPVWAPPVREHAPCSLPTGWQQALRDALLHYLN